MARLFGYSPDEIVAGLSRNENIILCQYHTVDFSVVCDFDLCRLEDVADWERMQLLKMRAFLGIEGGFQMTASFRTKVLGFYPLSP